ncbi:MAG: glycosyltransferase [Nitrospirae bacterium]|nr:glycosyltransferase [Nitrospirota bacterium]
MPSHPVTVLMPVYNGGDYLRQSIRSVLDQTFGDFELLIVNDCSTDDSVKVIESFHDPRIVIHHNEKNLGQTKSLNVGLKRVRSPYIARLDADDMACPRWLETLFGFLQTHPDCVVVGASSIIIDAGGTGRRIFRKPTEPSEILAYFLCDTPLIHGSVMMRADAIAEVGGYNEEFVVCQDYELWSALMRKNRVIRNVPDILVKIRFYDDSTCSRQRDRLVFESATTLHRNIGTMTDLTIGLDEASRLFRFLLCPETLSEQEFRLAEELFKAQYRHLKAPYECGATTVEAHTRARLGRSYSKRAIAAMQAGNLMEARSIASDYHRRYGFQTQLFMINLLSYLAKGWASQIATRYRSWQEMMGWVPLMLAGR